MTWALALFMLTASVGPKLIGAQVAVEAMIAVGWTADHLLLIGLIELVGTALFVYPRTGLLGAVLLTGLFGAAIASHLRVESPLLSHTLFGVYLGVVMWTSLWLRDGHIRSHFPFKQQR